MGVVTDRYKVVQNEDAFAFTDELLGNLISIESDFWNNHVIPKSMPEPDGSKACDEVLERKLYMKDSEMAVSSRY